MLHKPTLEIAPRRVIVRRCHGNRRRGIATLWTILFIPAILLLFIIAVEAGYLWLSRVELENSLEAAALAAVKEWGDANGGSTLVPRQIGVEYAAANTINGVPVAIGMNYDPAKPPNENDSCGGDLVFGAITNEDYECGDLVIFNAGIRPSCTAGEVLVDASEQGSLRTANLHEWGIAFHRDENTPDNLRIKSVTLDFLEPAANDAYFEVAVSFGLADDVAPFKVECEGAGPDQPDIYGFTNYTPGTPVSSPTDQIQWAFDGLAYGGTRAKILKFNFYEDPGTDPGFEPCDRFRFGVNAVREDTNAQYDGDEVGYDPTGPKPDEVWVTVTVEFSLVVSGYLPPASPQPPTIYTATGILDDTTHPKDCPCEPVMYDDDCPNSLIVHPAGIPDLPCPPAAATKNNGQSYALIGAAGLRDFAVRAQKTIEVPGLICWFCELPIGPFSVSACSTAMYDCIDRRPRLVRVKEFICPGP